MYSDLMDVSVVWFRRDLRLHDNEAVSRAAGAEHSLYVFVIDPWFFNQPEIGWQRVRFLFESLTALDSQLRRHGNKLLVLNGESVSAITGLLGQLRQQKFRPSLYFNHDIQVSYGRQRDESIETYCRQQEVSLIKTHNYFLLHDESHMNNWWQEYYKYQYAPQFEAGTIKPLAGSLQSVVAALPQIDPQNIAASLNITLPVIRQTLFTGGENAARKTTYSFLKNRVNGYRWKISRPYQAQHGATSLLGPHLAFGTVSNRTVFQAAVRHRAKLETVRPKKAFDIATYLDRLRWRDSFTQRLWFHPELSWENRFPEFNGLYNENPLTSQQQDYFEHWKAGTTGFPLLDAAMRELQADGFINFRMRAMAATFLTINCGISWHHGARHFMNCLVDGDIAINHWQWQMQAGVTNPLSPTFRIYNPSKNLRDRDTDAAYVHFWLPETQGKNVDTLLGEARPMLDFKQTRLMRGKVVSDLRKQVRARIIQEKGSELLGAEVANRTIIKYGKYSADRYKRYMK